MTRARHSRFLDLSALDTEPLFADLADAGAAADGAGAVAGDVPVAPAPAPTVLPKPPELSWWDWAVYLLHTAAEIEHALMVQYLYAAYSLADGGFTGTAVPPDAAARTKAWRRTIVAIAREEMGHLLTEQNLLRFLGAPLNLEREDFPFRSDLYPFPLELSPLTRTSLARYVSAEMPAETDEPDVAAIVQRATDADGGVRPNRVGILFDTLVAIFEDETRLVDADFRPGTASGTQAAEADWFAFGNMIVRTVATRAEAVAALHAIGEQGEGSEDAPAGAPPSHFAQFLAIYRVFPETEPAATGGTAPVWVPTRDVPVNPTTGGTAAADPAVEHHRITHPTALLWARLANVRYRMLLADLTHALALPGPYGDAAGVSTPRGALRDGAFAHMETCGASQACCRRFRRRRPPRRATRPMPACRSSCPSP